MVRAAYHAESTKCEHALGETRTQLPKRLADNTRMDNLSVWTFARRSRVVRVAVELLRPEVELEIQYNDAYSRAASIDSQTGEVLRLAEVGSA